MRRGTRAGLVVCLSLLSGCAGNYVMATKDGRMLMTTDKPQIDHDTGLMQYTDQHGQHIQINSQDISGIIEK